MCQAERCWSGNAFLLMFYGKRVARERATTKSARERFEKEITRDVGSSGVVKILLPHQQRRGTFHSLGLITVKQRMIRITKSINIRFIIKVHSYIAPGTIVFKIYADSEPQSVTIFNRDYKRTP